MSISERRHMINQLRQQGITDERVLEAMSSVPRHLFIEPAFASYAYQPNRGLPLAHGQTISQAYTVGLMTQLLLQSANKELPSKVLEIGTGSGYQAAVLSMLIQNHIVSIELIKNLHEQAKINLAKLDKDKIVTKKITLLCDNGQQGHVEHAAYDGILITACASTIPNKLIEQLQVGAVMIFPLQQQDKQMLIQITKTKTGYEQQEIAEVNFVKLL